jgi:hypothetical protein
MSLKSRSKIILPDRKIVIPSFKGKTRDYVDRMFSEASSTSLPWDAYPDDYDPLDVIAADGDFDLSKMMDKAIDPITGLPRDIRLPEGDFPEAKNYYDYCENFLGPDSKFPFARQMWAAIHLLSEWCPKCSHPKWTDIFNVGVAADPKNIPNNVQLLHFGVCPKCKGTKAEFIARKELNLYVEGAWLWGQRAGKSTLVGSLSNYILHKYLKFPKMSSICEGIQSSTPLTATFIGLRFADAVALLWEPITKGIEDSPWFKEWHGMLDDYGNRLGVEFYRFKDQYLRYAHKNIELYPAGPSKRALRGRTRFLTGSDEIGWFPVGVENKDLERADADEVHTALDRSLLTMRREVRTLYKKGFSNFIPGIAINISSPSDETDKICRLVAENKGSTRVLALQLATWEISPLFTKDNEEIADAFAKNPIDAERDYGAKPPMNARSFMDMSVAVRGFTGLNRAVLSPFEKTINEKVRRAARLESWSPENPQPASVLSIDAGLVNNSFSLTIQTISQQKVGDIVTTKVKVPVALEIQTRPGTMLHYSKIYSDVIKPLIKHFNVRYMFADRWNSVALLDTAEEDFKHTGLIAKQHSVKYPDFLLTRSYLEEGKLVLPKIEMELDKIRQIDSYPSYFEGKPAAHLLFQFATVRDMGTTVVKGGPYTDDTFRALVLGVGRILDAKIMPEILRMSAAVSQVRNVGAIAMGRSLGMSNNTAYQINKYGTNSGTNVALLAGNSNRDSAGSSTNLTSHVVRANRSI